jgi:hypothetical protein
MRPAGEAIQVSKKADVVDRPEAFHHVGLLSNEPLGAAEPLFIQSSEGVEPTAQHNSARIPERVSFS